MTVEEMLKLHSMHNDEELNQGNLDVVEMVFAPDCVRHNPNMPDIVGHEAEKQFTAMLRASFPDLQMTIEDRFVCDDKLVVRWTGRGTHQGEYMGIPPRGKELVVSGISIHRFADGKIQESWDLWDALGMLQQMGVVPVGG